MNAAEAIRQSAVVSDATHVAAVRVEGAGAFEALDAVIPRELFVRDGQILHTPMPIMRVLLEKTVHRRLSRDNDTILAALEGGLRWHRMRRARTADTTEHAAEN